MSDAEIAGVILFHHRHMRRIERLAGRISTAPDPHLTPPQITAALEECQSQRALHEARAFELVAKLQAPESPTPHRTASAN